jgi:small subunit ribosomal protein S6
MRNYELVTIVNPELDEEGIARIREEVNKFISDKNGIVEEVNQWGKRKLAYPIKKFMEGNYSLTRFELEPDLIKELEAKIRTSEEVLRHLVVKVGD